MVVLVIVVGIVVVKGSSNTRPSGGHAAKRHRSDGGDPRATSTKELLMGEGCEGIRSVGRSSVSSSSRRRPVGSRHPRVIVLLGNHIAGGNDESGSWVEIHPMNLGGHTPPTPLPYMGFMTPVHNAHRGR
jgi:hypothetical protein